MARYPRRFGSAAARAQSRAAFTALGGFLPVLGAALSSVIESNTVTLSGLVGSPALTITGGQYSKNGGAYSSAATTVTNGDTLKLRVTSSANAGETASVVATIDGSARTFSVTTAAATGTPTPTPTPGPTPTPTPTYLGQVANRSYNPTSVTGPVGGPVTFRSIHTAAEALTQLQVVYGNWAVLTNSSSPSGTGSEVPAKNTIQLSVNLEFPVGNVVGSFLFGGATSYTFPANTAENKISDVLNGLNIPAGAKFGLSGTMIVGTTTGGTGSGFPYTRLPNGVLIDTSATEFINNNGSVQSSALGVFPLAIVAPTTRAAVAAVGDSRVVGQGGDITSNGNTGEIAGAVAPAFGLITIATPSDRAAYFTTKASKRRELLQYVTHVIYQLGINDLNAGNSTASELAGYDATNIQSFRDAGKKVHATTIAPITSSTDSWATLENQTISGTNAPRVATNQARRAAGWNGVVSTFDTATAVESAQDSGKWAVNGNANFLTADGIHETQAGNDRIKNSGAIVTATIVR